MKERTKERRNRLMAAWLLTVLLLLNGLGARADPVVQETETVAEETAETSEETTDETAEETAEMILEETTEESTEETVEEIVEETPVEETPVEETPAEETTTEDTPEAETPAEGITEGTPEEETPTVEVLEEDVLAEEDAILPLEETDTDETISTDANFILVQKTFTGVDANRIPPDFAITVRGARDTYRLTKSGVEGARGSVQIASNGLVWKWKILGAEIGTYTVSEENAAIEGYTHTAKGDTATVTVEAAQMENLHLDIYTTCSHLDWVVNGGHFFAATLTSRRGSLVITQRPLSASERAAINAAIKAREKGTWKEPVHYYSFQDKGLAEGEMFTIVGDVKLSYSAKDGMIYLQRTSDWQHVISGTYDMRAPSAPEIGIENSYRKNIVPVTVTKRVEGNMADRTRAFAFEMQATVMEDGQEKTAHRVFSLKDGESVTFEDIVPGTQLVITEEETNYVVRIETDGDGAAEGAVLTVSQVAENGLSVTYTNTKNAVIDTGVARDTLPLAVLLVCAAALCGRRMRA